MPVKRTYKRAFGSSQGGASEAKKKRKTYSVASKSNTLALSNSLLATSQTGIMRYHGDISLAPSVAGAVAVHHFSANGLYDPDITGTGHQPRGFDQMMSLYDHYIVDEAVIEVWAQNTNASSGYILSVAVKDTASTMVRDDVFEETVTVHKAGAGTTGGPTVQYLRLACKPYQFLGMRMGDSELKGNAGANPSETCIFTVSATAINSAVAISEIRAVVKVTYKARFIEPKRPSAS